MSLPTPYYEQDGITLYHGDCREIMPALDAASVDMVFTDPPYLREFIPLYGVLSREAARVCKPSAFVYAYAGSEHLPDYVRQMTSHLSWYWLFNIKHNGGAPRVWSKRLMVTSKPVVVCTNGPVNQNDLRWSACDCASPTRSKEWHEWGQSPGFAFQQIELRTRPGDLILDPFAGGGTTLRVAKDTGRQAIGIEVEEEQCELITRRMAQSCLDIPVYWPEVICANGVLEI